MTDQQFATEDAVLAFLQRENRWLSEEQVAAALDLDASAARKALMLLATGDDLDRLVNIGHGNGGANGYRFNWNSRYGRNKRRAEEERGN